VGVLSCFLLVFGTLYRYVFERKIIPGCCASLVTALIANPPIALTLYTWLSL